MEQNALRDNNHTRLLTLNGVRIVFALLVYLTLTGFERLFCIYL